MGKRIIFAAILSAAAFGLQACFYWSSPPAQYGQYGQSQPGHTVCDVNGHNCLACDANDTNCQGTAKSSWGFFFQQDVEKGLSTSC